MKKEFVMRGQTASGETEILSFSGHKKGYAYRLVEFTLYPSAPATGANELAATLTAGKTAQAPASPDFNDEGLIGTVQLDENSQSAYGPQEHSVINDTFLITQDLILMVQDYGGSSLPINWQCRFESVKMSKSEEAVTNYRQFMISDD